MLIIAHTDASVVTFFMLRNKQYHSDTLYSMTSVVVLFAYPIKLNIWTRNQGSCILILSDLCNAISKMLDKISFHKHFNDKHIIAYNCYNSVNC